MCCKVKKLAWCTDEDLREQNLDYRFLELLVLYELKSDISDRLKKAGMTTEKYSSYFLDQLIPLLEAPHKYLAVYLKKAFHPGLKEEKMSPEMEAFHRAAQKQAEIRRTKSRPKSAPLLGSEDWTVVTPVPHIRCPCYPQRTYTPIVTEEEKFVVERQKTDVCYKLHTQHIRSQRERQCALEHFLPGYQRVAPREPLPPRPSSVPLMRGAVVTREVPQGTKVFERLSTPSKRLPCGSPCHALACSTYRQAFATKEGPGEARGTTSKKAKKFRRRRAKCPRI